MLVFAALRFGCLTCLLVWFDGWYLWFAYFLLVSCVLLVFGFVFALFCVRVGLRGCVFVFMICVLVFGCGLVVALGCCGLLGCVSVVFVLLCFV